MTIGLFRSDVGGASHRHAIVRTALRRLGAFVHSVPEDAEPARLRRLADVCAVLEGARASLVDDGWVQNRWYGARSGPAHGTGPGPSHGTRREPTPAAGACLVGAVVRSARRLGPAAGTTEAGPAL